MDGNPQPPVNYWDLLRDIAHVQAQMGEDLIAWARAHEAGGEAFRHTAQTLSLMADVGQRTEQYLQGGLPAIVQQTLQLFNAPWQSLMGASGMSAAGPFARFWEQHPSPPPNPSRSENGPETPPS